MKILNIKINSKIITYLLTILIIITSFFFCIKLFSNSTIKMNDNNYISILKDVHKNPQNYINKNIDASGYVFRIKEFRENQFVLAKNMKVSENEYQIIGFLCETKEKFNIEDSKSIHINGEIEIGNFYGVIPIIQVFDYYEISGELDYSNINIKI